MPLDIIDALSTSLAEPLNRAVQTANGAQFALMLSLMFEAKTGRDLFSSPADKELSGLTADYKFAPMRIDHSLALALESGNAAAFNLYNCLYRECSIGEAPTIKKALPTAEFPAAFDRRGRGGEMIKEIEKSKQQANRMSPN